MACCVPAAASASPVLSASAGQRLGALLEAAARETGYTLAQANVRADGATAQFCAGERCVDATLIHSWRCEDPAGEFCVTWSPTAGPAALVAALRRGLSVPVAEPLWQQVATAGVDPRLQAVLRSYRSQVQPSWEAVDALSNPSSSFIVSVMLVWLALAFALGVWLLRRGRKSGPRGEAGPAAADHVPVNGRTKTRFALVVAVAWIAVALGVHHAFPFYAMDMYSGVYTSGSQIAVLDAHDRPHSPRAFGHWRCPPLPSGTDLPRLSGARSYDGVDSRDRTVLEHVRAAPPPSTGALPMRLVRRVWRFEAAGVVMTDLPIATCEVAP